MPYFLDIALRQAFDDMPLDRDDRRYWHDGKVGRNSRRSTISACFIKNYRASRNKMY
jgi:hypothetical protein